MSHFTGESTNPMRSASRASQASQASQMSQASQASSHSSLHDGAAVVAGGGNAAAATAKSLGTVPEQQPLSPHVAFTPDATVKIRMGREGRGSDEHHQQQPPSGPEMLPPVTVMDVFEESAAKWPAKKALAVWRDGKWVFWTYEQYHDFVRMAAKAFIALGLQQRHAVAILGFNSPEWFIADIGAIYANGLACGIYTTNSPEACHYIIENARANIVLVENDCQLQKILKVRDRLPLVKAIVQYQGALKTPTAGVYTWNEFLAKASLVTDEELESRTRAQNPGMCCTLIYTSGTTGPPKGVMLSHDNITWTASRVAVMTNISEDEHVVSYLPLSHVAAQMMDLHVTMRFGATTWFAKDDALKGSLLETVKAVRPTVFLGVPRVWEKVAEGLLAFGKQNAGWKQKLAAWAKQIGLEGNMSLENGGDTPWGWSLANFLVFSNLRESLGLDRCKVQLTSAAPISRETLDYFLSINIPLCEVYGMSESSGPQTISIPERKKTGCCGFAFVGAETRIHKPGMDGSGEICMRGRHVFMGYLFNEEKTREAIDDDGWLHSGDVGKMDADGFLQITGRIKEILITAGGENVAPLPIEHKVKELVPLVSNAMLIGDKRKFLSCLLTLKCNFDSDGNPLPTLSPLGVMECEGLGVFDVRTVGEAKNNLTVIKAIEKGIDRVNEHAISHAQQIRKWIILPIDFSVNGGELGPTLKLRRHAVLQKYQLLIDNMYGVYGPDLSDSKSLQ